MTRQRIFNSAFVGTITAVTALLSSKAAVDQASGVFSITDENDAWSNFFGPHQDRHYTHGVKLTYIGGDDSFTNTTAWLNKIQTWGMDNSAGKFGVVAGQNMYTPENILDPRPITTDRPYAGWLYAGLVFQRRIEPAKTHAELESFEINFGVVGHYSLADETQELIHRWRFPEDIPQGWDNQIKNEPGFVLKYARLWRLSSTEGVAKYFDVIPRGGFELGNVALFATAGVTARLGYHLPDDFGVQIIDSPAADNGGWSESSRFSCYGFASVDERAVLHDITLDGNSFRSGPSVDKYNFVNDLSWGVALRAAKYFEISFVQVTRSKEFRGQQHKDVFGSIDIKFECSF